MSDVMKPATRASGQEFENVAEWNTLAKKLAEFVDELITEAMSSSEKTIEFAITLTLRYKV